LHLVINSNNFSLQLFIPLSLAAAIFSMQGVLPFAPNFARFTGVLFSLCVLVVVTLLFLFKWTPWIQPIVDYVRNSRKAITSWIQPIVDYVRNSRKAIVSDRGSTVRGVIRDSSTSARVLEEGIGGPPPDGARL
jgi:hypothetical protein